MKTSNIEHRTLNIECFCKSADAGNSMFFPCFTVRHEFV